MFHMGARAISWSSKKQHIVALSSTEAEYIVQTHAAKEALWLHSFLRELCSAHDDPLILNCDNQGAIALAKDNKFHMRTKHIDMRYHFIREVVEDGKVTVQYIPTGDNVSDIFTKPLTKAKFWELAELLRQAQSHARCKNVIHLCTLPAYLRGSVKFICDLHS